MLQVLHYYDTHIIVQDSVTMKGEFVLFTLHAGLETGGKRLVFLKKRYLSVWGDSQVITGHNSLQLFPSR